MRSVFRYEYIQEYEWIYENRPDHQEYVKKKSNVWTEHKNMKYTKKKHSYSSLIMREKNREVPFPFEVPNIQIS